MESSPTAIDSMPDWSKVDVHPRCPLCGYDLFGLESPRCPECGYPFTWAELMDPKRREHPYLFEHHPEANFRSYWKTVLGAMRPRRFWSSLNPVQPSRPKRLILYWCLGAALYLLAIMGQQVASTFAWANMNMTLGWRPPGSTRLSQTLMYAATPWYWLYIVEPWLMVLSWSWLTWLTLLIFRVSMRRAKINAAHVLRCALYSFDPVVWACMAMTTLVTPIISLLVSPSFIRQGAIVDIVLTIPAVGYMMYRLIVAYRRYLRFDHPVLTVLASQAIVLLAVVNLYLALNVWM